MNAKYRGNKKLQNSRIIKGEEHVKIYSHPDKKCLYYDTSMLSRYYYMQTWLYSSDSKFYGHYMESLYSVSAEPQIYRTPISQLKIYI